VGCQGGPEEPDISTEVEIGYGLGKKIRKRGHNRDRSLLKLLEDHPHPQWGEVRSLLLLEKAA